MTDTGKRLSDIATTEVERRVIAMYARGEGDAETLHEAFGLAVAAERARIRAAVGANMDASILGENDDFNDGAMAAYHHVLAIIEGADDAD